MKKRNFSWLCLIAIFFTACEKAFTTVVDFDIPHTPHLVLGCELSSLDTNTIAYLSASKNVTAAGDITPITSGNIKLYEDNVLIGNMNYQLDKGGYTSSFHNFMGGKRYKIVAEHPSYKTIIAEETMPTNCNIESIAVVRNARRLKVDLDGTFWFDEVKIKLKDNANTSDNYTFSFSNNLNDILTIRNNFSSNATYCLDTEFDTETDGIDIEGSGNFFFRKMYLKDKNFNGSSRIISIFVSTGQTSDIPPPFSPSLYYRIENISDGGYKYEKTKAVYDENGNNPFSEPIQVYNNVDGGNGIFRFSNVLIDSLL
jgi:hypothetical protein